ncbi:NEUR [Mytilus coruscus]|uniref:NEUR n=1 Tax=Mytilus coruscus TaxID=42192 RepID=A0A6J8A963_MYTCO|nr:NEUR [Mytilus coruscus]
MFAKVKLLAQVSVKTGHLGLNSDRNDSTHESRIKFHKCHSCNVRLNYNKTKAYRDDGFTDAVCFSNRPIAVNEKINVRLIEITNEWDGALRFGFTNQDPAVTDDIIYSLPLGHGADICAYVLFDEYAHKNKILHYWFESNGCLIYNVDNEPVRVMNSNIKADVPLWAVIDLYGKTVGIEFVSKGLDGDRNDSTHESLIKFHKCHSCNVRLNYNKTKAYRNDGFTDAVCFSNRPIAVYEKINVRLIEITNEWDGALRFGFTNQDPAVTDDIICSLPLGHGADICGYVLFDEHAHKNKILHYWFESNGCLIYNVDNEPVRVMNSKIKADVPLWAVIDLYGKTVGIEFVSKGLKSKPYHSYAENILHFNDVHGGNVILSSKKSKARRIGGFEDAVCFSNRPIVLNEKMYVRLKKISNELNGALKFGFTSHYPALNLDFICTVPLGYRTHSWIDELFGKDVQTNNTLQFWFESNGSLMYNVNNGPITVRNYKVNTDVLLWAVIDMYGKTVEIEMVTQSELRRLTLTLDKPLSRFYH